MDCETDNGGGRMCTKFGFSVWACCISVVLNPCHVLGGGGVVPCIWISHSLMERLCKRYPDFICVNASRNACVPCSPPPPHTHTHTHTLPSSSAGGDFGSVQELQPRNKHLRHQFVRWVLHKTVDTPQFLLDVLWTDEAVLTISGAHGVHNLHIWAENPHASRDLISTFGLKS
jgi:hypothetical protein